MDIKDKIRRAIETQGVDYEKLKDLFDVVSLCEDKAERREWLLRLAVPEHGLLWTFIVCPVAGLFVAGINLLLG